MSVLLRRAIASASILSLGLLGPVGLSACTTPEAPPSPAPTAEARTVAPLPKSGDINVGAYLVTSFTENFEITVPDGWSSDGDGLSKDDPDHPDDMAVFVGWWPSDYVATDA
jgi:hypothetical protein